jgi:hypothetical protein
MTAARKARMRAALRRMAASMPRRTALDVTRT